MIAELKRQLRWMPIIGNGDVRTVQDAHRMQESTGCDFVMIGRAALGNPWIFRQLLGGPPPSCEERCAIVLRHFGEQLKLIGDELATVRCFRKHLAWYAHGLRGASSFRAAVNRIELGDELRIAVRAFFSRAEPDRLSSEEQPVDYRAALG